MNSGELLTCIAVISAVVVVAGALSESRLLRRVIDRLTKK